MLVRPSKTPLDKFSILELYIKLKKRDVKEMKNDRRKTNRDSNFPSPLNAPFSRE